MRATRSCWLATRPAGRAARGSSPASAASDLRRDGPGPRRGASRPGMSHMPMPGSCWAGCARRRGAAPGIPDASGELGPPTSCARRMNTKSATPSWCVAGPDGATFRFIKSDPVTARRSPLMYRDRVPRRRRLAEVFRCCWRCCRRWRPCEPPSLPRTACTSRQRALRHAERHRRGHAPGGLDGGAGKPAAGA